MMNSKRKCLYISLDHIIDNPTIEECIKTDNGIVKKIICQYLCMIEDYCYDVELFCPYKKRNHFIHSIARRLPLSGIIPYGKDIIKRANEFDFVYLRSPWFLNGDTPRFIKKIKERNKNIKVVVELPTFVSDGKNGEVNHFHMYPLVIKNKKAKAKLLKYIDRFFTFYNVEEFQGIKVIQSFNAINCNLVHRNMPTMNVGDGRIINLVCCSSMAFWHGYDRIINGLKNYYSTDQKRIIYFHVIGNGEELINLKKMVDNYDLKEYVIFYGELFGEELDQAYNNMDIAIDSLGRHRSNIFFNSSLKGKEYCAKGLPIISGVTTELDFVKDYPYYYRIPADDTDVDMEKVLEFYDRVYFSGKNKCDIIDEIVSFADESFSYKKSLKPLIDYWEENDNDSKK